MSHVHPDPDTQRYVIKHSNYVSCWGFQNCFDEVCQLAELTDKPLPQPEDFGTMHLYLRHAALLQLAQQMNVMPGLWFHRRTPDAVRVALLSAWERNATIRVHYGETDPAKPDVGRDWLEEYDVSGRVDRSMGPMRVPLLVTPGADGAPSMLDHCIVKISEPNAGRVLYQHPRYRFPTLSLHLCAEGEYRAEVLVDGAVHARFTTEQKAINWIAYMKGERSKP